MPYPAACKLTLPEYSLIMAGWNKAHEKDDIEAPTPEEWEREQARIAANPQLTGTA